ncbi:hypothetical protein [Bdellovibrio sp. NC01]|nr:hypothetical protein [Bdellovibrio sp. NC01]
MEETSSYQERRKQALGLLFILGAVLLGIVGIIICTYLFLVREV